MAIDITILGIGSASPGHKRHPSSQVISIDNNYFMLIDCGEGTQFQLQKYKISHTKLTHIFISHLHGDHYFGLIGLISTMHLFGRNKPLYIYGPAGLAEILTTQLKYSETVLNYTVHFQEIDTKATKVIFDHANFSVSTIPLSHRIPCCGFLIREKLKRRRIQKENMLIELSPLQKKALKNGEDITDAKGNVIKNESVTLPPKKSCSYAYCSDTQYDEAILPIIQGVDILYHESTFTNEHAERAKNTYHSTAQQAATIASKANVSQLLIGHFSSRYYDLDQMVNEAKAVFDNVAIAEEGKTFSILD